MSCSIPTLTTPWTARGSTKFQAQMPGTQGKIDSKCLRAGNYLRAMPGDVPEERSRQESNNIYDPCVFFVPSVPLEMLYQPN